MTTSKENHYRRLIQAHLGKGNYLTAGGTVEIDGETYNFDLNDDRDDTYIKFFDAGNLDESASYFACAGRDGLIFIFDAGDDCIICEDSTFKGVSDLIRDVAFEFDGIILAADRFWVNPREDNERTDWKPLPLFLERRFSNRWKWR